VKLLIAFLLGYISLLLCQIYCEAQRNGIPLYAWPTDGDEAWHTWGQRALARSRRCHVTHDSSPFLWNITNSPISACITSSSPYYLVHSHQCIWTCRIRADISPWLVKANRKDRADQYSSFNQARKKAFAMSAWNRPIYSRRSLSGRAECSNAWVNCVRSYQMVNESQILKRMKTHPSRLGSSAHKTKSCNKFCAIARVDARGSDRRRNYPQQSFSSNSNLPALAWFFVTCL
jgi:hypothetical protein